MNQLTLENIETKTCLKCKKALKCESIIDEVITYFCPTCLKEYTFTICLNCSILFETNEYRLCNNCNKQAFEQIMQPELKPEQKIIVVEESHG
jgi:hypothetical protein